MIERRPPRRPPSRTRAINSNSPVKAAAAERDAARAESRARENAAKFAGGLAGRAAAALARATDAERELSQARTTRRERRRRTREGRSTANCAHASRDVARERLTRAEAAEGGSLRRRRPLSAVSRKSPRRAAADAEQAARLGPRRRDGSSGPRGDAAPSADPAAPSSITVQSEHYAPDRPSATKTLSPILGA